jgi:hypothetical protein
MQSTTAVVSLLSYIQLTVVNKNSNIRVCAIEFALTHSYIVIWTWGNVVVKALRY